MATKEAELISEKPMKCEMPNNPDRLANSDKHKNIARHVPLKSDHNTELMTEAELIIFLRIPEISSSKDYHNVIEHLKRIHELPRVHICRKALYPRRAILEWVEKMTCIGK